MLGLDSKLKHDLDGFERYFQLRDERLQTLRNGEISIRINQINSAHSSLLSIKVVDSGPGFNDDALSLDQPQANEQGYHGRGLKLLKGLCSRLEFLPPGNQVIAELRWDHGSAPP